MSTPDTPYIARSESGRTRYAVVIERTVSGPYGAEVDAPCMYELVARTLAGAIVEACEDHDIEPEDLTIAEDCK